MVRNKGQINAASAHHDRYLLNGPFRFLISLNHNLDAVGPGYSLMVCYYKISNYFKEQMLSTIKKTLIGSWLYRMVSNFRLGRVLNCILPSANHSCPFMFQWMLPHLQTKFIELCKLRNTRQWLRVIWKYRKVWLCQIEGRSAYGNNNRISLKYH